MTERDDMSDEERLLDAIDRTTESYLEALPEEERAVVVAQSILFVDKMVSIISKGLGPIEMRLIDRGLGGKRIEEEIAIEYDKPIEVVNRLRRRTAYKVLRNLRESRPNDSHS